MLCFERITDIPDDSQCAKMVWVHSLNSVEIFACHMCNNSLGFLCLKLTSASYVGCWQFQTLHLRSYKLSKIQDTNEIFNCLFGTGRCILKVNHRSEWNLCAETHGLAWHQLLDKRSILCSECGACQGFLMSLDQPSRFRSIEVINIFTLIIGYV